MVSTGAASSFSKPQRVFSRMHWPGPAPDATASADDDEKEIIEGDFDFEEPAAPVRWTAHLSGGGAHAVP